MADLPKGELIPNVRTLKGQTQNEYVIVRLCQCVVAAIFSNLVLSDAVD